eukprot:CAMPEP_0177626328 /NCGR_PEP_ID=MMETSP0419_2-20121207/30590_1 /TAXON_ID=582737 /ORGANISM="Tetraselmis sp., Strain GSL018" /LENGTH=256 /DNA_ID=CAMNT_0019127365 /DNA_START=345 /DNA_END=1117 /DNA_ORIENTATION=+
MDRDPEAVGRSSQGQLVAPCAGPRHLLGVALKLLGQEPAVVVRVLLHLRHDLPPDEHVPRRRVVQLVRYRPELAVAVADLLHLLQPKPRQPLRKKALLVREPVRWLGLLGKGVLHAPVELRPAGCPRAPPDCGALRRLASCAGARALAAQPCAAAAMAQAVRRGLQQVDNEAPPSGECTERGSRGMLDSLLKASAPEWQFRARMAAMLSGSAEVDSGRTSIDKCWGLQLRYGSGEELLLLCNLFVKGHNRLAAEKS